MQSHRNRLPAGADVLRIPLAAAAGLGVLGGSVLIAISAVAAGHGADDGYGIRAAVRPPASARRPVRPLIESPAPTIPALPAALATPAGAVATSPPDGVTMAPAPAPRPAAQAGSPQPQVAVAAPPPPPRGPIDRLTSDDGTLDVHVGRYTDCSGNTPLPRWEAEIDTCIGGVTYFLGHNPGVFTPMMHMGVGSVLTWHDQDGAAHGFRVVQERDQPSSAMSRSPRADVTAQFQACLTPDGVTNRIFDAVSTTDRVAATPGGAGGGINLLGGLLTSR